MPAYVYSLPLLGRFSCPYLAHVAVEISRRPTGDDISTALGWVASLKERSPRCFLFLAKNVGHLSFHASCLLPSLLFHYNAATGDIEMGELLCDSLDAASDSDFLRFAISSDEVCETQARIDVVLGSPSVVESAP